MIEIKAYHDGGHYVGIPQKTKRSRSRFIKVEEYIEVEPENKENTVDNSSNEQVINDDKTTRNKPIKMTKKELFNKLYEDSTSLRFKDKQPAITNGMKKYFGSYEDAKNYVEHQLENKRKSIINKRKRFYRKVAMNEFNYFVTFTYADNLHTEQSFQKKLKNCLGHLHNRKGWKYAGVFEKSKSDRLHFHGLLYIPEGQMVGKLLEKKDYNLRTHKMQNTTQNTFFNSKFGRSDFERITKQDLQLGNTAKYSLFDVLPSLQSVFVKETQANPFKKK